MYSVVRLGAYGGYVTFNNVIFSRISILRISN